MKSPEMINLSMSALDDLFTDARGREENKLPQIHNIPLAEIDDFENHPFQVRTDDEDMEHLKESIDMHGVMTPVTLRKKENGRYEMISGHRRKKACELLGKMDTIPAKIIELTNDEAIILMVESNLQRSKIVPSEKAKAYKMRHDAIKRQGERTDKKTSHQLGGKLPGQESAEIVGKLFGDSASQVRRYKALNDLDGTLDNCDEFISDGNSLADRRKNLLDLVDEGLIGLSPAEKMSKLHAPAQKLLREAIASELATPTASQVKRMLELQEVGKLNEETILEIMQEQKPNQCEKISIQSEKITALLPEDVPLKNAEAFIVKVLEAAKSKGELFSIQRERIAPFLPKDSSPEKTEEYIVQALHHYHHYRQRQRQNDAR